MTALTDIVRVMNEALENMQSEKYVHAANLLSNRKSEIREQIQEVTSEQIKSIIQKLGTTEQLTQQELEYVRLWLVGDAESYTEMENNFEDWLDEFKRLIKVLEEYSQRELTTNELFGLQGIIEDAIRVAMDIKNFLEKKERVKNFQNATKDAASLDREILVKILRGKLHSSEL